MTPTIGKTTTTAVGWGSHLRWAKWYATPSATSSFPRRNEQIALVDVSFASIW